MSNIFSRKLRRNGRSDSLELTVPFRLVRALRLHGDDRVHISLVTVPDPVSNTLVRSILVVPDVRFNIGKELLSMADELDELLQDFEDAE